MIITLVILAIDWIVLLLNQQTLLGYHAVFISCLVIFLRFHSQPAAYIINSESFIRLGKLRNGLVAEGISNICQICQNIKPARYYHCRKCNKCIYRMDHHCSWVGNCIGQYNSKVYLHLIVNIFIHSGLVILVIIANCRSLFDFSQYIVYYLLILIPCLYAFYESYRLIRDFRISVKNNQTLIESYKKVTGKRIKMQQNWRAYMGSNIVGWLIPYFQSHANCDLLEKTYNQPNEQVKECTYADEYIDGSDQEQMEDLQKQK